MKQENTKENTSNAERTTTKTEKIKTTRNVEIGCIHYEYQKRRKEWYLEDILQEGKNGIMVYLIMGKNQILTLRCGTSKRTTLPMD